MCGIAGAVWTATGRPLPRPQLDAMVAALTHRGPDDCGSHIDEVLHQDGSGRTGVALGHRRLSIIDVDGGHQPLANEDNSVWVAFNGEIYNYRDLRRRLEGSGHTFRTCSDTEVLVHLYEDEGPRFVEHVNGMFAIAIWDANRQRLVLARDRLGQKPLVYYHQGDRLLFASELKALRHADDVPRDVDPAAVDLYLTYQYIPHPHTIFRGIRKLPPAHVAVFERGNLSVESYWRPPFQSERRRPRAEVVEELGHTLAASVRMRLMSEVPLGAFLSGGVDSSLITALAQAELSRPLKTFSISFPIPEYDESEHARHVAAWCGTDHQEFRVEPDAVSLLPDLVHYFDEPFADSSAIPTYYLSQKTREHVTVALTGDGGDELFAGYPRYRAVRLGQFFDRLPAPLRDLAAARLWQRLPASARQKSPLRRFKKLTASLASSPDRRYLQWIAIFDEDRRAELYTDEFIAELPEADPLSFLSTALARASRRDAVTRTSLADLVTYLPCDLMTKVDIASMAHSLECRQPFLDHRLVELAAELPLSMKFRRLQGKRILRDAFDRHLPASIWKRPKMGFGVPLDHWFRGPLAPMAREVLLDPATIARGYFRTDVVTRLLDEHISGQFDHAYRLWALLVLEYWHREWSG